MTLMSADDNVVFVEETATEAVNNNSNEKGDDDNDNNIGDKDNEDGDEGDDYDDTGQQIRSRKTAAKRMFCRRKKNWAQISSGGGGYFNFYW